MITFNQGDGRWELDRIGSSTLTVGKEGCLLTAFAMALADAGYEDTPADVASQPIFDAGLFDWYRAVSHYAPAVPGIAFSANPTRRYVLQRVTASFGEHWLLRVGSLYYDPLGGIVLTSLPAKYVPGVAYSYDIPDAPVRVTDTSAPASVFQPFDTDLSPSQAYNPEVARMQQYLADKGFMADQGSSDGYYGPVTQAAVNGFQKAHGVAASKAYFGWWYPQTRAKANLDLTYSHNEES